MIVIKTRALRLLMAERGYSTQRALAAELGVKESYLSQLFSGKRTPSLATVDRLCYALDCQPGELLEHVRP